MKKQHYLRHFGKNFSLAFPVMLSQLGHVLVGVADSTMVGQLGAIPLAAASLANVIFHVLLTFGLGISYAITPLVAAADGEGDIDSSILILKHGFLINMISALVLFALVAFGGDVLYLLEQPAEVVALALPYLGIITLSIIPFMFFQTFRQFAEGLSFTRQAMYISLVANVVNVILNYALIYGRLGLPALGLDGAGWATLISRVIMGLAMMTYILRSQLFSAYRAGISWGRYQNDILIKMLKIGLPSGLQFTFEVGAFGCAAVMMGWLGTTTLAAHQIAISLASVSYMMATGLSAAATIRVGNQRGKNDIVALREVAFSLFLMVLIFMTFCACILIVGRNFLPMLYIDEAEVVHKAAGLVVIAGLFQLSDGIQVVGLGALRGLTDVKVPTAITFIAYWLIGLPLGYVLGFWQGMQGIGIWIGLLTGLSIAAVSLFVRFNSLSRSLN